MAARFPLQSPHVQERARLEVGLYTPIPLVFFRHPSLRRNGRPYYIAIHVLAEILNWYRPIWEEYFDEHGQLQVRTWQRFRGRALQLSYEHLAQMFGLSVEAIRRAVYFLRDRGLLVLETVHIQDDTGHMSGRKVLVHPVWERIREMVDPGRYAVGETAEAEEESEAPAEVAPASTPATERHSRTIRDETTRETPAEWYGRTIRPQEPNGTPNGIPNGTPNGMAVPLNQIKNQKKKPKQGLKNKAAPPSNAPDNVLRELGLPRKYRRRLAPMMHKGKIGVMDFVAELARCYRQNDIKKPVIVAALSLLDDNRAPREFYNPDVIEESLPPEIATLLRQHEWLPRRNEEDEGAKGTNVTEVGIENPDQPEEWKMVLTQLKSMTDRVTWRILHQSHASLKDGMLTVYLSTPLQDRVESFLPSLIKKYARLLGLPIQHVAFEKSAARAAL